MGHGQTGSPLSALSLVGLTLSLTILRLLHHHTAHRGAGRVATGTALGLNPCVTERKGATRGDETAGWMWHCCGCHFQSTSPQRRLRVASMTRRADNPHEAGPVSTSMVGYILQCPENALGGEHQDCARGPKGCQSTSAPEWCVRACDCFSQVIRFPLGLPQLLYLYLRGHTSYPGLPH